MNAILDAFGSELAIPIVVVILPPYRHIEGLADAEATHRWMARLSGVATTVVDTLPELFGRPPAARRALRFVSDYHPTPEYHETIASVVLPHLRSELGAS